MATKTDAIKVDVEPRSATSIATTLAQTGSLKGRVVKVSAAVGVAGVVSVIAGAAIKYAPIWVPLAVPALISFAVTPPGLFVLSFLVTVLIGAGILGIGVGIYLLVKKMRQPSAEAPEKSFEQAVNQILAEAPQSSFQQIMNKAVDAIPKKIKTTTVQTELQAGIFTNQVGLDGNRTGWIQQQEISTENPIRTYFPENAPEEFMECFNQLFLIPS